jgi:tetratricopeptide (TPR) repeat protein
MQKVEYEILSCKASALASIGSIEFQQKNYAKALELFQDALLDSKRAAVSGVALERIRTSSRSIGNDNRSGSSISSSSKRSHKDIRTVLKDARILVADMYSNIASTLAEQGNRQAAIENYNNALALHIQELGEDHATVACTIQNIGTMHYRSGEYHLALKSYRQVLKMRRLLFNSDHTCVADCLLNIATVHEKAQEIEKAVSALNAALRIMTKHYSSSSLQCADINMQLGSIYARTGCQELAMEYYQKAHEILTLVGLEESNPRMKAVTDAMHYVKTNQNKKDEEDNSSFLSATETWSNFFTNSCGNFCIPEGGNGVLSSAPAAVRV